MGGSAPTANEANSPSSAARAKTRGVSTRTSLNCGDDSEPKYQILMPDGHLAQMCTHPEWHQFKSLSPSRLARGSFFGHQLEQFRRLGDDSAANHDIDPTSVADVLQGIGSEQNEIG